MSIRDSQAFLNSLRSIP